MIKEYDPFGGIKCECPRCGGDAEQATLTNLLQESIARLLCRKCGMFGRHGNDEWSYLGKISPEAAEPIVCPVCEKRSNSLKVCISGTKRIVRGDNCVCRTVCERIFPILRQWNPPLGWILHEIDADDQDATTIVVTANVADRIDSESADCKRITVRVLTNPESFSADPNEFAVWIHDKLSRALRNHIYNRPRATSPATPVEERQDSRNG